MRYLKKFCFCALSPILFVACAQSSSELKISQLEFEAIGLCQEFIESNTGYKLSVGIDRAYIDVFPDGVIVSFTQGEVGTFGARDKDYKQHWACGISGGKILKVSAPLEDPILDLEEPLEFEKYDASVIEKLYVRKNNNFEYCCEQALDANNLNKHKIE